MKQNVTETDFHEAFRAYGRADQFSPEARTAIFDYLEDAERDMGEEYELDVIALCCEWAEYPTPVDAASEYGWEAPEREDDEGPDSLEYADRCEESALEWLHDRTTVIELDDNGVVLVQF